MYIRYSATSDLIEVTVSQQMYSICRESTVQEASVASKKRGYSLNLL